MRRPLLPGTAWVLIGALALAGVGVAATSWAPESRVPVAPEAEQVPVVETTVACPGLRSRRGFTESVVAAATPPQAETGTDPGGVGLVRTLTDNPADSRALITLQAPGDKGSYVGRGGERDSVVGRAVDALAPGFSVTQTERTVDGAGRGLAGTACLPTGSEFWFVGAGAGVGQRAVLVLVNPENATASVDVALFGRSGALDAPGGRGVQVAPRTRVELRLDQLAPGQRVLAAHVQVQVGRLSAALTETDVRGIEPRGTDWLPSAVAPRTSLVVPGVPQVARGREGQIRVDVVAPGPTGAVVTVSLATPEGTFVPLGNEVIEPGPDAVASLDVTEALRQQPGAILLESDAPITAGARVLLKRPGFFGDVLYLAAVEPFASTAVVPDNRDSPDLQTRLVLTAPEQTANVRVTTFAGDRRGGPQEVEVFGGSTVVVNIDPPRGADEFGLLVEPLEGSGPVYGVRWLDEEGARGPLVTSLPLRAARLTTVVPTVVPDLGTGTLAR